MRQANASAQAWHDRLDVNGLLVAGLSPKGGMARLEGEAQLDIPNPGWQKFRMTGPALTPRAHSIPPCGLDDF